MTIIHIPKRIKTTKIAHMLIYDVVCCYYDKYTKSVQSYRGENALYMFIKGMLELEFKYRRNIIKYKSPNDLFNDIHIDIDILKFGDFYRIQARLQEAWKKRL